MNSHWVNNKNDDSHVYMITVLLSNTPVKYKSVCAGQVTEASIAMPIEIVQFSQHNLSMKKANVNNKTIEGLQ